MIFKWSWCLHPLFFQVYKKLCSRFLRELRRNGLEGFYSAKNSFGTWVGHKIMFIPKNLLKTCFARLLPRSTKQNSTSFLSKNQIKECFQFCSYLIKYEFSLERSVYYHHYCNNFIGLSSTTLSPAIARTHLR
jgi:hypothetical protein